MSGDRSGVASGESAIPAPGSLSRRPATELRDLMLRGEVSPVELLEECLGRVDRHDGVLNAVVTLNPDARGEARRADERLARARRDGADPGLLCGLPVGVKDVTETAGLRTTYGSPLYADHVPEEDAEVVRRLRAAGAVVLGKTNTPEFAAGGHTFNPVFGRTRNPWDPALSPGGSTGGGAAALAAGMVALAEGTDLGGSLRVPAAFCGVVGLRPSPGLVPTHPTAWAWDTLQVTGPMARTAEDVALMLEAVAGPTPLSPLAAGAPGGGLAAGPAGALVAAVREASGAEGLRLGYVADPAGVGIDPRVEAVCREGAFALGRAGHRVEEVELDLSFARRAFLALRGLWMVVHHRERLDRLPELGPALRGNIEAGLETTARELADAEADRTRLWHLLREALGRFDALLAPCTPVPPFPAERDYPESIGGRPMETYVDWIAPTFVFSLAGLPVVSVPAGLDEGGLPAGLQVVCPPRGEVRALGLAARMQRLRPVGLPRLDGVGPSPRATAPEEEEEG